MNKLLAIGVGLALLVLLLLFTTTYSVAFHEVAVKTRFGQAGEEPVVREPGLHFKLPFFVDQVTKFDTRYQIVESSLEPVQVADKQQVLVRTFLLWQVEPDGDGPLQFFKSYGSIEAASLDLEDQLSNARGVLGEYAFDDLLGAESRLEEVEARMLEQIRTSSDSGAGVGVRPVRVGISKLVLPPATTRAVLERMKVTRETIANNERQKGLAESQRIVGDASTKADKLRAFATMFATEIRAEGDRAKAEYLERMNANPEFALFLTWRTAFEQSLNGHSTLILPADMAPFHYLDTNPTTVMNGIPLPDQGAEEFARRLNEAIPASNTGDDDGADTGEGE